MIVRGESRVTTSLSWGVALTGLLAFVVFALGWAGVQAPFDNRHAALVWLVSGVAFSAVFYAPRRGLVGVIIGTFALYATEFQGSPNWLASALWMSVVLSLEAWLGCHLVKRWLASGIRGGDEEPEPLRATVLILAAASCSVLAGVLLEGALTFIEGPSSALKYLEVVSVEWISSMAGVLIIFPVTLLPRRDCFRLPGVTVIALLFVGLSFFLWIFVGEVQYGRKISNVRSLTLRAGAAVRSHFEEELIYGRALAAFFEASERVAPREFDEFSAQLLAKTSSVMAVSYLARVSGSEKESFEAGMQEGGQKALFISERSPSGHLVPASPRSEYVPLQFMYPPAENKSELGLDYSSNPVFAKAMLHAKNINDAGASSPVETARHPGKKDTILVFHPVFKPAADADSREAGPFLAGFAVSYVSLDSVFSEAKASYPVAEHMDVSLVYHPPSGEEAGTVLGADAGEDTGAFEMVVPFEYAGQSWSLVARLSNGLVVTAVSTPLSWTLLLIGLAMGASVALVGRAQHLRAVELESGRRRLAGILDTALMAVIGMDEQGCVVDWNSGAASCFGYSKEDALGKKVAGLIIPQRYRDAHAAGMERYRRTGEAKVLGRTIEIEALAADGREFPIELSITELAGDRERRFVAFARDISSRREISRRLHESEKLAAMGQLTGGMAHDFNNLLGVIIGNLDLFEEQFDKQLDEEGRSLVETARNAALKGAGVTRSLLAYARRQPMEIASRDLNELLNEMMPLIRSSVGSTIAISAELASGPVRAILDASGFANAVLNLVVNARDAMQNIEGTPRLKIRTRMETHGPEDHRGGAGYHGLVEVEDNGVGMSQEVLARVFDPYFTTKEVGQGTGLGLSIVHGYMEQLGGSVRISSVVGHGTTVVLYFPCSEESAPGKRMI